MEKRLINHLILLQIYKRNTDNLWEHFSWFYTFESFFNKLLNKRSP